VLFRVAGVDLPRVRALWRLLWVKALVYAGTIIVIVHLFFVAPLLPDSQQQARCVENVHLTSWLGYAASCDSNEFIFDARNPGTLSVAKSFRQSRPLQITVAALMERVEKRVVEPTVGRPYNFPLSPGWFPYVVLNFVLLLAALLLFDQLVLPGRRRLELAVGALVVLLCASDVVKGFFWSAHTQMWNVLLPLISIQVCAGVLVRPDRSVVWIGAVSMLAGIGALAYGSLIIVPPALLIALAIAMRRRGFQAALWPWIRAAVVAIVSLALPTLVWYGILKHTTGSVFNSETTDFREYVWITDALKHGGVSRLIQQTGHMLRLFIHHVADEMWPAMAMVTALLAIAARYRIRLRELVSGYEPVLAGIAITLVVSLPFFGLQGFYRDRLAFNLVVPLVVLAGILAVRLRERLRRPAGNLALAVPALTAVGVLLGALLKVGPYV
jgi:hypothetical protein